MSLNNSPALLGIRHHGPGSASSLLRALEENIPDILLVEGPPDAQDLLPWMGHEDLQPPAAILIYVPDEPKKAVYYPFAAFSPEWQAIRFALQQGIPVRFMDLPQANQLALENRHPFSPEENEEEAEQSGDLSPEEIQKLERFRYDPLDCLAEIAGFSDGERWWEYLVEQRRGGGQELFEAITLMMVSLREGEEVDKNVLGLFQPLEAEREANMRQMIRDAQTEGFEKISVVCGAWHVPALQDLSQEAEDKALLKGLKKCKTAAAWVPWSYGRLSRQSGYGAGIASPGWYEVLWQASSQGLAASEICARWLTLAAKALRSEDLAISSAHVIEAVRLAETLAALRGQPLAGLNELNDAVKAVFCFGDDLPLQLVHEKLIINERLGKVPEDAPMTPLQSDLARLQKSLRLPPEALQRELDLDLRKPNDLKRSHLLHRLALLNIHWGDFQPVSGKSGSFHEIWKLKWEPDLAVQVVEASLWGNTVYEAALGYIQHFLDQENPDLPTLTGLVNKALLAEIPEAVETLISRLEAETALSSDTSKLMETFPPLADVQRYGNVRQMDTELVSNVLDGLAARICIGLPPACSSLDDAAAYAMFSRIVRVHSAMLLLQNESYLAGWYAVLQSLANQKGLHGLLAGRANAILLFQGVLTTEDISIRLGLSLSKAASPEAAAAWIEGLLKDSGALLIHEDSLWKVLDDWLGGLSEEEFVQILPLLRRTFSTFTFPERRLLGEKAKKGEVSLPLRETPQGEFDLAAAEAVLPLLEKLLGLQENPQRKEPL